MKYQKVQFIHSLTTPFKVPGPFRLIDFKAYQSHETLIDVDRTVFQINPVVHPGKLDVEAQVQGEGLRVNLIEDPGNRDNDDVV